MTIDDVRIEKVKLEKPEDMNIIIGQSHFIKTVEDLEEALVNTVPGIKYGIGFCEASGQRLVRYAGNDSELVDIVQRNCMNIGAGHFFMVAMKEAFPINVLRSVKSVPEVCNIYAATANPVELIIAETELGRGILGVIDGSSPVGVEGEDDIRARIKLLRDIGYKK